MVKEGPGEGGAWFALVESDGEKTRQEESSR